MMDMRAAEMEVQFGNPPRDNQEDKRPRRDEREEKETSIGGASRCDCRIER